MAYGRHPTLSMRHVNTQAKLVEVDTACDVSPGAWPRTAAASYNRYPGSRGGTGPARGPCATPVCWRSSAARAVPSLSPVYDAAGTSCPSGPSGRPSCAPLYPCGARPATSSKGRASSRRCSGVSRTSRAPSSICGGGPVLLKASRRRSCVEVAAMAWALDAVGQTQLLILRRGDGVGPPTPSRRLITPSW